MIYWPTELPAALIGTTYSPVDPQMRTTMQSGRTLARRKFTVVPVHFQARWVFRSDAQAALFEEFYRAVTTDGAAWFVMPILLPSGNDHLPVRFSGIYSGPKRVNPPGRINGAWEYSATIQIHPKPEDFFGALTCGLETEYLGGEAFPSEFTVQLGSGLGSVLLEYATGGLPDKFEVWLGGVKVLDTGYVGNVSNQSALNIELAARGLPPETITQRSGNSTVSEDWSNPNTRDYAAFVKTTATSVAAVRVYAPLSGTAWRCKLNCPDGS